MEGCVTYWRQEEVLSWRQVRRTRVCHSCSDWRRRVALGRSLDATTARTELDKKIRHKNWKISTEIHIKIKQFLQHWLHKINVHLQHYDPNKRATFNISVKCRTDWHTTACQPSEHNKKTTTKNRRANRRPCTVSRWRWIKRLLMLWSKILQKLQLQQN